MQNLGKFRALGAVLRDCSHIEVDFAVPLSKKYVKNEPNPSRPQWGKKRTKNF